MKRTLLSCACLSEANFKEVLELLNVALRVEIEFEEAIEVAIISKDCKLKTWKRQAAIAYFEIIA